VPDDPEPVVVFQPGEEDLPHLAGIGKIEFIEELRFGESGNRRPDRLEGLSDPFRRRSKYYVGTR